MPEGLFDHHSAGRVITAPPVAVERGRVAMLCDVIGETNPIHFDPDAARAAGYPGIVAPPTFAQVVDQDSTRAAIREGRETVLDVIRGDFRYLLHGGESYRMYGAMLAGDLLEISHEVLGFEIKKGGALEFAHILSRIESPDRGLVVEVRRTMLHRLPPVASA